MTHIKIAIAVPIFPNIVQTYVLSQLTEFRKLGVNFFIIASVKRKYETLPPAIEKYKLLDDVVYISTEPKHILKSIIKLPLFNSRYRQAASRILRHGEWGHHEKSYKLKSLIHASTLAVGKFDIIHSHSLFSTYNYLFMKEVLSIPIITTYHGQVPKGVCKIESSKMKMVFENCDAFVVNTIYALNELIDLGCKKEKIHIIPQGIIIDDFPFIERQINTEDKIILLTIGRLSIEKGHHITINALNILRERFPTLEYHIVGDGPDERKLKALCYNHNLQDRVFFHGFKTGNELKHIFSTAHIFVLPSINTGDGYLVETQGVVLQEAQASGIPVIGSQTGGIPDVIVDKHSGFLFNENDYADLANKIKTLIQDQTIYHNIAVSGRKDVESRFDINVVCEKLLNLYNNIAPPIQHINSR